MNNIRRSITAATMLLGLSFTHAVVKPTKSLALQNRQGLLRLQPTETEQEEIRKVVKDSQFNETLKIYVFPSSFDKALLAKYWVPENKGGKAIVQVESSVGRLLDRHWHYSQESINEQFSIREIIVFAPGDVADVRTRERWYVPMIDDDGKLVKERDSILEFVCTYRLLKIDGRWLIQKSSCPYHED